MVPIRVNGDGWKEVKKKAEEIGKRQQPSSCVQNR